MTTVGKAKMEEWKNNQQRVVVCSQSGTKKVGILIDYDDTEIVLEDDEWYPRRHALILCHNWFSVEEASTGPCHD